MDDNSPRPALTAISGGRPTNTAAMPANRENRRERGIDEKYETLLYALKQQIRFAKSQTGELFFYQDGRYVKDDQQGSMLGKRVGSIMDGVDISRFHEDEICCKAKNHLVRHAPNLWDAPPEDKVNLLNGILDLNTMELLPHSPEWLSSVQIPLTWDPTASCPEWNKFLHQLFDASYLEFVYEVVGFTLTPKKLVQAGIWLSGPGGNGKSTLMMAISNFLGEENCLSVDINQLDKDKFIPAELDGKLLVVDYDTKKMSIDNSQLFKKLVTGDPFIVQRKNKNPFTLKPCCKMVYCGNTDPSSKDKSFGFRRRFVIVPMVKTFSPGTEGFRRQDELLSALGKQNELSGLLNQAVMGWRRLKERGAFRMPPQVESATEAFKIKSHPFSEFRYTCIMESPNSVISREEFRIKVNSWMQQNGHPEMNAQEVGKMMSHYFPASLAEYRTPTPTGNHRAYVGIEVMIPPVLTV